MVKEARITTNADILIGTEAGIIYRMEKENPEKNFHPVKDLAHCSNMKKIDLSKVLASLEDMKYKVEVPVEIRLRAKGSIEKMVKL
jgi:quinolinate synthase